MSLMDVENCFCYLLECDFSRSKYNEKSLVLFHVEEIKVYGREIVNLFTFVPIMFANCS